MRTWSSRPTPKRSTAGTTIRLSPRTFFACPVASIHVRGSTRERQSGSKGPTRIHSSVHGHVAKVTAENVSDALEGVTFAFVAVDQDDSRMEICDALGQARIPFVVVGVSVDHEAKRLRVTIHTVTVLPNVDTWRTKIPRIGQAGQEDYGSVDLPDVYAMTAGWAIQAWRRIRGQFWQEAVVQCLDYYTDTHRLYAE